MPQNAMQHRRIQKIGVNIALGGRWRVAGQVSSPLKCLRRLQTGFLCNRMRPSKMKPCIQQCLSVHVRVITTLHGLTFCHRHNNNWCSCS